MFSTHLSLEPSSTIAINSLAIAKKARGERVYNLSAGEPEMAPHRIVASAAAQAIADGRTLYTPAAGIPELRLAAAAWMNRVYQASYQDKNTLITCGGKFGIFAAVLAFVKAGEEVIVIPPYWVSYPSIVRLFGATPVFVNTMEKDDWKIDLEKLKNAITPKTKMLIINNGGNPTGVLYSREELRGILNLAAGKNILVLSDEVYGGLAYDDEYVSAASFAEFQDRVIVVQSCSKNFAMTGWRVGLIFGPEEMIKILTVIQSQSTTGTSSISQYAALAAIENSEEITAVVKKEMRNRRDFFIDEFNNLFNAKLKKPSAGLYSFFPLSALGIGDMDSVDFCKRALNEAGVALVPGIAFGAEGYVRASFGANTSELKEALLALRNFCRGPL